MKSNIANIYFGLLLFVWFSATVNNDSSSPDIPYPIDAPIALIETSADDLPLSNVVIHQVSAEIELHGEQTENIHKWNKNGKRVIFNFYHKDIQSVISTATARDNPSSYTVFLPSIVIRI